MNEPSVLHHSGKHGDSHIWKIIQHMYFELVASTHLFSFIFEKFENVCYKTEKKKIPLL